MNGVMALVEEQNRRNLTHNVQNSQNTKGIEVTEDWEEPIEFDDNNLPIFDTSIFPLWIRDFVEGVAESTQTPIDAPSFACISVLSSVLSGQFEVNPFGNWIETLNTYTVMALDVANRKTAVFNYFIEPLANYEKKINKKLTTIIAKQQAWLKAKQKRIEKLERDYGNKKSEGTLQEIYTIKEEIAKTIFEFPPKILTSDVTPEKLAQLLYENNEKIAVLSSEGAEVFEMIAGRYSEGRKSNVDLYLKGHSADYVSVERMGRESIILYKPKITVGLFVQPSVIRDLPNNFQDRGVTQRFLYSFPLSKVGYRKIEPITIDKDIENNFITNISIMLDSKIKSPIQLNFTREAFELEIINGKAIEKLLRDVDISEGYKGWLGKLRGQLIRIAGLLHVANNMSKGLANIPKEIEASTLQKAINLKDYFIEHARFAHGIMGVDTNKNDQKYLWQVIQRQNKKKVDYRTIQNLTRKKFNKSHELKKVLAELEERYFIRNEKEGRKNIILVNPKLIKSEKDDPQYPQ